MTPNSLTNNVANTSGNARISGLPQQYVNLKLGFH